MKIVHILNFPHEKTYGCYVTDSYIKKGKKTTYPWKNAKIIPLTLTDKFKTPFILPKFALVK